MAVRKARAWLLVERCRRVESADRLARWPRHVVVGPEVVALARSVVLADTQAMFVPLQQVELVAPLNIEVRPGRWEKWVPQCCSVHAPTAVAGTLPDDSRWRQHTRPQPAEALVEAPCVGRKVRDEEPGPVHRLQTSGLVLVRTLAAVLLLMRPERVLVLAQQHSSGCRTDLPQCVVLVAVEAGP